MAGRALGFWITPLSTGTKIGEYRHTVEGSDIHCSGSVELFRSPGILEKCTSTAPCVLVRNSVNSKSGMVANANV